MLIGASSVQASTMNLSDRIYLVVHAALTLLACVRHAHLPVWPAYVLWNVSAMMLILVLARQSRKGVGWQFAHDWLPVLFFITVFEEVSFLSLSLRSNWQNEHVIAFEALIFGAVPIRWMHQHAKPWIVGYLEFGYFAFYPLYPVVGGLFWAWQEQPRFRGGFRNLTDTLSVGYAACYTAFLLFPTQSPANRMGVQQVNSAHGGVFQPLVRTIQNHAGVHGNAFPSAHIMLAFVVLVFVYGYLRRIGPWLLFPILLMCAGAVYDGYHYASDVIAGAALGLVLGAGGMSTSSRNL